jgi:hypothetical protein
MHAGNVYCDRHARTVGAWIPVIPGTPCEYTQRTDRVLFVAAAVLSLFAVGVLVVLVVVS